MVRWKSGGAGASARLLDDVSGLGQEVGRILIGEVERRVFEE
jgi:hypothetical protein